MEPLVGVTWVPRPQHSDFSLDYRGEGRGAGRGDRRANGAPTPHQFRGGGEVTIQRQDDVSSSRGA